MFPKFKHCLSCGYPLISSKDHGGNDEKNTWCKYCCYEDGTHKSYDEKLQDHINMLLSEKGEKITGKKYTSKEEAKKDAIEYLSKMPAWKGRN